MLFACSLDTVRTHFGEISTETMEGKIKRMFHEEIHQMMADE